MVTPYENIVGKINNMKLITVIVAILILAVGFFASYMLTRKIYKPISNVFEKLSMLSKEKRENTNVLKQQFLRSLIQSGTEYEMTYIKSKFSDFEIKLNPENGLLVLILKIDSFSNFCNSYNYNDRNLFKFAIANISSEICSRYWSNESIDTGDDHVAIIISDMNPMSSDYKQNLDKIISSIQETVKKYYDISLSVTVSSLGSSIKDVHSMYNEALECSSYRMFKGYSCITYAGDILPVHSKEYSYPVNKEELLVQKLMLGKIDEVKEIYKEIMKSAMDYSYIAFKNAVLRFFSTINAAIINASKINSFSINYNYDTFLKELNKQETIEEVDNQFFQLFEYISECFNERKNTKHSDLLNKINEIVHQNYNNPNLCLNIVADALDMSPIYLGRLFKNLTSRSIGDYINHYRMEKAKSLLEETDLSINEITDQIGILNKSHFYTIFKQKYSITPNEYRKSRSKQDILDITKNS